MRNAVRAGNDVNVLELIKRFRVTREKEEIKRNRHYFISDRVILPCRLFIAHFP